jgi:DNA-binding protein H-NS
MGFFNKPEPPKPPAPPIQPQPRPIPPQALAQPVEIKQVETLQPAVHTPPVQPKKFSLDDFHAEDWKQADLEQVIEIAQGELAHRKLKARQEALDKVQKLLADTGISLDELVGKKVKTAKKAVEAKYKWTIDGASGTWSGRGRTPVALQKLIDGGKKLEDFLIK